MNSNYSKEELLNKFQCFITSAGYVVEKCEVNSKLNAFYDIHLSKGKEKLIIHSSIKKISSAYFPNNDSVYRIQTGPIDMELLPETTINEISILVGYYEIENTEILALWNAFYFVGHKKNRSCYLTIENMHETIKNGDLVTSYSSTPVYITTKERTAIILDKFIEDNEI